MAALCRVGRLQDGWRLLRGLRTSFVTSRYASVRAAQQKAEEQHHDGANLFLRSKAPEVFDRPRLPFNASVQVRHATREVFELARARQFDEALQVFATVEKPDDLLYGAILNACCKGLMHRDAWRIWASMPKDSKTLLTYNTMLDMCKRLKRTENAESLFREMKAEGIEGNIITYNTMISAYSFAGETDRALQLFDEVRRGILSEASADNRQRTHVAIMSATARAGDYARTREIFMGMLEASIPPNILHLNALIASCAAQPLADIARQIFASIPAYGLTPRIEDYTALISCCRDDLEECQRIFDEALNAGLHPTTTTHQQMVQAHVLAGDAVGSRRIMAATPGLNLSSMKMKWLLEKLEKLEKLPS